MQIYKCIVHYPNDEEIKEVNLTDDQFILPQLENLNIPIGSDCREGVCACCQVKLIKGNVMDHNGEMIDSKKQEMIKACIVYPKSDLEIQLLD